MIATYLDDSVQVLDVFFDDGHAQTATLDDGLGMESLEHSKQAISSMFRNANTIVDDADFQHPFVVMDADVYERLFRLRIGVFNAVGDEIFEDLQKANLGKLVPAGDLDCRCDCHFVIGECHVDVLNDFATEFVKLYRFVGNVH